MSSLKHISKNFFLLLFGNVISQALFFYGILFIASALSPEAFGRFSFAQSFTLFFLRLAEFGLDTYSIRRLVVHGEKSEIVFEFLFARIYSSIIVFLTAVACLYFFPVPSETKIVTLICLGSLFGNFFLMEWFFQSKEQMHIVGVSRFIRSLIFTVPLVFLFGSTVREENVSWMYVLSFLIPSIFLFVLFLKKTEIHSLHISFQRSLMVLRESAPLGISATLMQIPFNVGTLMIGMVINEQTVGIYSAGYRISLVLWSFGIVAIYNAIYPTMTSLSSNVEGFEKFIKKMTLFLSVASGFLIISAIAFSQDIMGVLYHGKYDAAIPVLKISLVTVSIILARTAIEYSLLSLNKLTVYLKGMMFVSVLYIITGYVGIVNYGMMGMLYGSICSELLYTGYLLYHFNFVKLRREVTTMWLKISISSSVAVLMFYAIKNYNEGAAIFMLFVIFIISTYQLFKIQLKQLSLNEIFT